MSRDILPWDMPRFRNWIAVAKAHQMVEKVLGARLAPLGLKLAQHDILANICRMPGLTQNELAERLLVGRSNLSMLLPELERRGWVERRADPADRRVRRLHLTGEGQTLTLAALKVQAEVIERMMTILSDQECAQVGDYMRRIAAQMSLWGTD
ncbi:MarR family winged helix-turn-helix transcriptional regulator [Asticcacaulis sp. BYS171W]|uniref:MarR family winged helix-turn-helix transcriptional regulator n=1 Tax=Asticcacaulis aquaticus TaxID=2984212 RepID=A0ABT5HY36_9CAUL|nr:MarR family winged helix-turn-helix transcriptional regulator [Asticcacaulis aquaticus]MDC7684832.1 MarR family winged helix-turn-helix transcriptional regulator [Asticcacaulis aquaticus]